MYTYREIERDYLERDKGGCLERWDETEDKRRINESEFKKLL